MGLLKHDAALQRQIARERKAGAARLAKIRKELLPRQAEKVLAAERGTITYFNAVDRYRDLLDEELELAEELQS